MLESKTYVVVRVGRRIRTHRVGGMSTARLVEDFRVVGFLDGGDELGIQPDHDVDLFGQEGVDPGRMVGNSEALDLVDKRTARTVIVRMALEDGDDPRIELAHLPGSGTDGFAGGIGSAVGTFGLDREMVLRQQIGNVGIRCLHGEDDMPVAVACDGLDIAEIGIGGRTAVRIEMPVERIRDIRGRHGLAIVEFDTVEQLDGPPGRVAVRFPGRPEIADESTTGDVVDQPVVEKAGTADIAARYDPRGIQGVSGAAGGERRTQSPAALRSARRGIAARLGDKRASRRCTETHGDKAVVEIAARYLALQELANQNILLFHT